MLLALEKKEVDFLTSLTRFWLFDTQQSVEKGHIKPTSNTARVMCTPVMCQRVHNQTRRCPWVARIEVTEDFANKTCGSCKIVHPQPDSNTRFVCDACGYQAGRDFDRALVSHSEPRPRDPSTCLVSCTMGIPEGWQLCVHHNFRQSDHESHPDDPSGAGVLLVT